MPEPAATVDAVMAGRHAVRAFLPRAFGPVFWPSPNASSRSAADCRKSAVICAAAWAVAWATMFSISDWMSDMAYLGVLVKDGSSGRGRLASVSGSKLRSERGRD